MWKRLAARTLLGLAVMAPPIEAEASLGTGVGASPITLADPVRPGQNYQLPSLYVVNTGTEASDYGVHVARLSQGTQRDVPASWVHIGKPRFHLEPNQSTTVPLNLALPDNAPPGDYLTNLVAGPGAPRPTRGAAPGGGGPR